MNTNRRYRRGFSLMELLIVVAILMIIGAVAVPRIDIALLSTRETAAAREIQNLITAQTQYMSSFGRVCRFARRTRPTGQRSGRTAPCRSHQRRDGRGPQERLQVRGSAHPAGLPDSASPEIFGTTGRRTFYADQSGTIRQNWSTEQATPQSEELGG
jgi:prepilin-type N-terminal cleavage/methylation domain-containing protein